MITRISLLLTAGFFVIIGAILVLNGSIKQNALAFTSVADPSHNSQSEIYVLDWKRNTAVNVTRNKANEFDPEWSPDGTKLAFDSDRDGGYQIYVKDLDTGATSKLAQSSDDNRFPSWSPNSRYIAYLSQHMRSSPGSHQTWSINIVTVDGNDFTTIPVSWDETAGEKPIWSPTSRYLTFRVYSDGKSAIYSFDMETHAVRNGLTPEAQNWYPAWSPDGEYLSFMSQEATGSQVYVANIESGVTQPLSDSRYPNDTVSSWSPNGAYIAVVSNDMRVEVRERSTGKIVLMSPQFPSKLFSLSWLPNNEEILINVDYGQNNFNSGIYSLNVVTHSLQKMFQYTNGIKGINLAPQ